MLFDRDNHINKLCVQGLHLEGEGRIEEAAKKFRRAWEEATNDTERFTAAHYMARFQPSIADKLRWDEIAIDLALKIEDPEIRSVYPSLYLNIGKCHEDMCNYEEARNNYRLAETYAIHLADEDGYSHMIKAGINNAIERSQAFVTE